MEISFLSFLARASKRSNPNALSAFFDERKMRQLKRIVGAFFFCFALSAKSDTLDPTNYVVQVYHDCESVITNLNQVRRNIVLTNYDIEGLINYVSTDTSISNNVKNHLLYYLQQTSGSLESLDIQNQMVQNSVRSIQLAALNLQLSPSFSSSTNYFDLSVDMTIVTNIYNYVNRIYNQGQDYFPSYQQSLSSLLNTFYQDQPYADGTKSVFLHQLDTLNEITNQLNLVNHYLSQGTNTSFQISQIIDILISIQSDSSNLLTDFTEFLSKFHNWQSSWNSFAQIWTNSFYQLPFTSIANTTFNGRGFWFEFMKWNGEVSMTRLIPATSITFSDLLTEYAIQVPLSLVSLNNYHNQEFVLLNEIYALLYDSLSSNTSSNTNSSNSFSWDFISSVDRSPLDQVSQNYFSYLTNSYLSSFSGTSPNTNWFRRIEILLASLVFQDNHDNDLDNVNDDIEDAESDLTTLESAIDASQLFTFSNTDSFFSNVPTLPTFGNNLPQTLSINLGSWGSDSASESNNLNITINVIEISSLFDCIRACFKLFWWLLVVALIYVLFRIFLKGCAFSFKLIQQVKFS